MSERKLLLETIAMVFTVAIILGALTYLGHEYPITHSIGFMGRYDHTCSEKDFANERCLP